jgi:tetratricopeptide (TPR) repeat protein
LAQAPRSAAGWNGVGLVLMELKRWGEARTALSRAVEADSGFAAAHYNLSFSLSQLGDFDGALRATKRALELDPFYVPQKYALTIDLQFEDPTIAVPPELAADVAGADLGTEFAFDPSTLDRLFRELAPAPEAPAAKTADPLALARDYISKGMLERAAAELSRARARGAAPAAATALLGDLFARRGLHGEALERYREARAIDPDSVDAATGEIRALLALGRTPEAAPLAEALARRASDAVEPHVLRARVRLEVGDAVGALDSARAAQALAPGRADLLHLQARIAARLGDRHAAHAAYREALRLDGSMAQVWYELGQLEEQETRLDAARAAYERALEVLPTFTTAALALANLIQKTESAGAAVNLLVQVLETDPYELEALAALGRVLLDDGRTPEALEALERVLRFDPEHRPALFHRGVAWARQRRFEDAVTDWERVIQLDPAGSLANEARSRARSARDLQHIFATAAG